MFSDSIKGAETKADAIGATSNVGSVEFRVREVSEINVNLNLINGDVESSSTNCGETSGGFGAPKRKLPAWMLTQNEAADSETEAAASVSKKFKITDNTNENLNEGGDAEEDDEYEDREEDGDAAPSCSTEISAKAPPAQIKSEPAETEENNSYNDDDHTLPSSSGTTNPTDIKPAVKVEKADASSTSRESCKFGIRCYRRNPMHRTEEAHPGDHDYKRPNFPAPPKGTPDCPFGDSCYRRNPIHFRQFNHPPDTDFEKNYRMRLRQRRNRPQNNDPVNDDDSDLDDYDLNDPFIDDGDSVIDYIPSNEDDTEVESQEL